MGSILTKGMILIENVEGGLLSISLLVFSPKKKYCQLQYLTSTTNNQGHLNAHRCNQATNLLYYNLLDFIDVN